MCLKQAGGLVINMVRWESRRCLECVRAWVQFPAAHPKRDRGISCWHQSSSSAPSHVFNNMAGGSKATGVQWSPLLAEAGHKHWRPSRRFTADRQFKGVCQRVAGDTEDMKVPGYSKGTACMLPSETHTRVFYILTTHECQPCVHSSVKNGTTQVWFGEVHISCMCDCQPENST